MRGHTKPHNSVNTVTIKISVTPNPLQNLTTYADALPKNHLNSQTPKAQVPVFKLKFEKLETGQTVKTLGTRCKNEL